jgi:hypothetical protein
LPRWGELRSIAASAARDGDLNRIEDEVDGIVCAWLAWLWAIRDARLHVYGDVASGYIIAPVPPSHQPRPRLHRVLPSRQVRFVDDARSSTPVVAAPEFTFSGPSRRWTLTVAEANELERTLNRLRADG